MTPEHHVDQRNEQRRTEISAGANLSETQGLLQRLLKIAEKRLRQRAKKERNRQHHQRIAADRAEGPTEHAPDRHAPLQIVHHRRHCTSPTAFAVRNRLDSMIVAVQTNLVQLSGCAKVALG
jgi:hypothetical protein